MEVTLPADLRKQVEQELASSRYHSPDEKKTGRQATPDSGSATTSPISNARTSRSTGYWRKGRRSPEPTRRHSVPSASRSLCGPVLSAASARSLVPVAAVPFRAALSEAGARRRLFPRAVTRPR
jgi:hypothetical protein